MEEETEICNSTSLMSRVYYSARDGMAITLFAILNECNPEQCRLLLNRKVLQEDGQCFTPLIIAARFGHNKVIKMLLEKFKIDIEQEGRIKFDGFMIEGASALWCAAALGHLHVVKTLVNAGGDVNHPTKTNSTPVRAACFEGRLDIVKYLTDHSANIHIANKQNDTCLMVASYKGHLDIVKFLLENKADVNEQNVTERQTALHYAAESGHCNIVCEMVNHGAKMMKNAKSMTPLMSAAERARDDIVEYFIQHDNIGIQDKIEAYELLGASFANDNNQYNFQNAYTYLHKAMMLRYGDPNNIIRKTPSKPVPAYENWQESETVERLESIQNNQNAIHMESLTIRERILGTENPDVPQPIIYRGAVFADNARFDRCIDLWSHALHLRQKNKVSVSPDLLRFSQIFSQMIHVGVELQLQKVVNVFKSCILELSMKKKQLGNPEANDSEISVEDKIESDLIISLYILTILTKLLTLNEKQYTEEEVKNVRDLIHELCNLKLTLKDGQTLLHLAVNADTPVDDFHTNHVCRFPCAATTRLLIQCGADVNAMDKERNTPLHIIVQYEKPISDFMTLHGIILDLIQSDAHVDIVNSQKKTPYNAATTGVAEIILRAKTELSLKCLAAKAVKDYNLQYSGYVPRALESFIELHGAGLNDG